MLIEKTWERWVWGNRLHTTRYHDIYTGWFLFGIIPLFIRRERNRA